MATRTYCDVCGRKTAAAEGPPGAADTHWVHVPAMARNFKVTVTSTVRQEDICLHCRMAAAASTLLLPASTGLLRREVAARPAEAEAAPAPDELGEEF